jgi:DNA invertase Pin-like site-specific DNA recombinase
MVSITTDFTYWALCKELHKAQLERELISERVKNGLKNAVAKGRKVGRPKTRPAQSIISLYEEDYSYRKIAKLLGISHTAVAREVKAHKRNQITPNMS